MESFVTTKRSVFFGSAQKIESKFLSVSEISQFFLSIISEKLQSWILRSAFSLISVQYFLPSGIVFTFSSIPRNKERKSGNLDESFSSFKRVYALVVTTFIL